MKYGLLAYIYKFFEYNISNIEEIKSVDLFFNQFESQKAGESDGRANPRVLIEIDQFETKQDFGKHQHWVGSVTLHVGIDVINTFYSGSETQVNNLQYLDLLDKIYTQLSFTSSFDLPEEINNPAFRIFKVSRKEVIFAKNEDSIKVTEIDFEFIVEDYSLVETAITDTVDNIDVEILFQKQC